MSRDKKKQHRKNIIQKARRKKREKYKWHYIWKTQGSMIEINHMYL